MQVQLFPPPSAMVELRAALISGRPTEVGG